MRKPTLLILLGFFLLALACTPVPTPTPPEPTPALSPQADAGGGLATPEPGDTAPEQFEGSAGIVEKLRPSIEVAILKTVRTGKHANFDRVVFEFEGKEVPKSVWAQQWVSWFARKKRIDSGQPSY